jgi:hypothetical protein
MVTLRRHPELPDPPGGTAPGAQPGAGTGGRLNLLLTAAPWAHDSWADRLPHLLDPMGIRSVTACSAREAEYAIRRWPIHIAVVDLGVPLDSAPDASNPHSSPQPASSLEEAGPRVLELLRRLTDPPPTVVIKGPRCSRDNTRHMTAALRCDAFAVVDRTAANLETMLQVLHRCLARFYSNRWPGTVS